MLANDTYNNSCNNDTNEEVDYYETEISYFSYLLYAQYNRFTAGSNENR
jgi:hypothetical protein